MQKILNHLIQLQDLMVARAEQEVSMPGARLAQLDASIAGLLEDLPPDIRTQFTRIQKKDLMAIIPVSGGVCTACGISLPVSLVNAVKAAEILHKCPNCARLLFCPALPLRGERKRKRRGEPPKLGVERFSSLELMVPSLVSHTVEDVLAELSAKLESVGFADNAARLTEEALRREAIVSTAVDHGLAFPHVRGVEGGGLTMALGISKKGLKFGGPSRSLTRIVFFMVIPTAASAFYLKLLSGLTQTFGKAESREKLLAADTPDKLWKTLLRLTKVTVP